MEVCSCHLVFVWLWVNLIFNQTLSVLPSYLECLLTQIWQKRCNRCSISAGQGKDLTKTTIKWLIRFKKPLKANSDICLLFKHHLAVLHSAEGYGLRKQRQHCSHTRMDPSSEGFIVIFTSLSIWISRHTIKCTAMLNTLMSSVTL